MGRYRISLSEFLKKMPGIAVGAIGFLYIVSSSALGKEDGLRLSEQIILGFISVSGRRSKLLWNFIHLKECNLW